ncbi:MAG: enoyl-CoA hydratase-related protein [Acidimicrobiales bacterium]
MPVQTETMGPVRIIRLDREAKRNAINAEMTEAIDGALNEFEDDPAARVAVITGGTSMFCAGTDIAEGSGTPTQRGGLYGIIGRRSPKPIIAAVEGFAFGGGFEIALACDLIVAASDARFGLPEVRRGLVATSGGMFRAPRALPLNVAREMLLTGDPVDAPRLERLGLVNRLAEPGTAVAVGVELAERIVLNAPTSIRETLAVLGEIHADEEERGWAVTRTAQEVIMSSEDRHEGVSAFFEKRTPDWPGS